MAGALLRRSSPPPAAQKKRKAAAPENSWPVTKLAAQVPTKPIAANIDVDLGSFAQSELRRLAHYFLQIPMYFIKFPLAVLLGVWSALFWRTPTAEDVVALVESTSLITALRRDWAAERTAPSSSTGVGGTPLRMQQQQQQQQQQKEQQQQQTRQQQHQQQEQQQQQQQQQQQKQQQQQQRFPREADRRCYYVRVEKCLLEHAIRKRGGGYDDGVVTPIKSWSMSYTKTRPGSSVDDQTDEGREDQDNHHQHEHRDKRQHQHQQHQEARKSSWVTTVTSFHVNGEPLADPESQMSFLHLYLSTSAHTKSHVLGNALVERIVSDDLLKSKLMESTWTTTWLHHGLLHGSLGPLTSVRTEANNWMGLGSSAKLDSVLAESRNMSSLGGADHGCMNRWSELDLPLSDFILSARKVLRRAMRDNAVPLELQEGLFLSIIMHALDHVVITRLLWGVRYNIDFTAEHTATWGDRCESACWSFMWVAPTLHPFFPNKIRSSSRPFYQQLYRGLKKIDILNIADEATASIMY